MPPASSSPANVAQQSGKPSSSTSSPSSSATTTKKANGREKTTFEYDTPLCNSDVADPLQQRRMREQNEFIWANFGEPHAERRRRILAKYGPEIKKLMTIEWKTKWIAFAVVITQMTCSYTLPQYFLHDFLDARGWRYGGGSPNVMDWAARTVLGVNNDVADGSFSAASSSSLSFEGQTNTVVFSANNATSADGFGLGDASDPPAAASSSAPWYTTWFPVFFIAWLFGGALTQNMFLGIHEISHNTAFKKPFYNDLLCMWCNLVVSVPFAMMFKSYHQEHHRYLGWEGVDTDLPEHVEAWLLRSLPGKVFFLFFQTLFYALRPMISRQPKLKRVHYINWAVMVGWWLFQYAMFGQVRFIISYIYCTFSSLSTGLFHPTSGHFISEHYVFNPDTFQETYSYYGLGNIIGWNVGYHNEHHDFPSVPWSLLPKIKEIAPEFYEPLESTTSWSWTLVEFLRNKNVSEFSRVKRERGAGRRKGHMLPTTPADNHTPAADPTAMRARLNELSDKYPYDSNNCTIMSRVKKSE